MASPRFPVSSFARRRNGLVLASMSRCISGYFLIAVSPFEMAMEWNGMEGSGGLRWLYDDNGMTQETVT